MLVAVAGVLPVAVAAGLALWAVVQQQWNAAEGRTLEVTRLAAAAIKGELDRGLATLNATAASPLLDRGDMDLYEIKVRRVLDQNPHWQEIYLARPDGSILLHAGKPVLGRPAVQATSPSFQRVVRERRPVVGKLRQGDGGWGVPLRVPVMREGKLAYVLSAGVDPGAFLEVLRAQNLPGDWITSVFDADGLRVARSREHARTIGSPPALQLQDLMRRGAAEGTGITETLEGHKVYTAFVRLPDSAWSVAIGIPTSTVEAGAVRAFATYGGGAVASLLLALMWALLAARGISGPIAELRAAAIDLGRGVPPAPPDTEIMELRDLGYAIAASAEELRRVERQRQRAEALAAESELRLGVALDSSIVPFSVLSPVRDAAGVVVDFAWEYASRAAAAEVGHAPADLPGQTIGKVAPETWRIAGVFETLVAVAEHGQPRELEVCTTNVEPERCLQMVATPMSGKVAVWSADVTHRKQQERALQAADRRKDEFLAVLAHELRNPLAPIEQAAMISNAPGATDAQKRWSHEVIGRQVRHMALLLEDLLDVSRITRGKLELRKSQIELRAAIDAAVETARPHLEAKGHRLTVDLPPAPVLLNGDALRIAQVVTNLLTNAARYTDQGGAIRITAGSRGGNAWIRVEDNGMGIAPEHLESIFEMFAQGRSGAAHGGGLGIGLALARGIAQLHGGTLVAESPGPGQGSAFTLTLPLGEAQVAAPALRSTTPGLGGVALRVLVADDNRDAAETLASLLRMSGHEAFIAYDGESALREFDAHRPDVAILDIGMPALSGYEVAREIRRRSEPHAPPLLVAVTGWGQVKDKLNAQGAGFDHHLTKPVDMRALFAILRKRGDAAPARATTR